MGQSNSIGTGAPCAGRRCSGRCCGTPLSESYRFHNTVRVNPNFHSQVPLPSQVSDAPTETNQQRPRPEHRSSCFCAPNEELQVEVTNVLPRSATVQWVSTTPEVIKFHIVILQVPPEGSNTQVEPIEIAFFDADPGDRALTLPPMTLERSSGPFVAQVTAEVGIIAMCRIGCSKPFNTPAEPPCEVLSLRAVWPQAEREIRIEWDPPPDDGGAPIEGYEVALCPGFVRYTTRDCCRTFGGLSPGSVGMWVEVCAKNAESIMGPISQIAVATAVGMPSPPTDLRAWLAQEMPWTGGSARLQGVLDSQYLKEHHDYDIVHLEFLGPDDTGGQELDRFVVCAREADRPIASLSVAACIGKRVAGETRPRCKCSVPVGPNQMYTFSVAASNGVRASCPSAEAPPLFVPARVPAPPFEPPTLQHDPDAQLRVEWASKLFGGGLPLLSFKIGLVGPIQDSSDDCHRLSCGQLSEFTVPIRDVICGNDPSLDELATDDVSAQQARFAKRISGLSPGANYICMIAATNGVGTGQWSDASCPLRVPLASPGAPRNLVATVTTDAHQNVTALVSWDVGSDEGCEIVACSICLVPIQVSKVDGQNLGTNGVQRINLESICTARPECALNVPAPGRYRVEVFSENRAGNCSPPAILPLDVRQDAFPPKEVCDKPRWAKQPLLVLGTTEDESLPSLSDICAENFTPLHTMLLWEESSSACALAPVDVLCFYRHPVTGQPRVQTLASAVPSSRLLIKLPARVPVALCLMCGPKTQDLDPLVVHLSENGKHLTTQWQVWELKCPNGATPRWMALPDCLQNSLEAAWLEGRTEFDCEVAPIDSDSTGVSAGRYQVRFGDEVSRQHSARKLGVDGWRTNLRREVIYPEDEDDVAHVGCSSACVVCLERDRTHAFMHDDAGDGHLAVCGVCAQAYSAGWPCASAGDCPVCRRPFSSLKRIFH